MSSPMAGISRRSVSAGITLSIMALAFLGTGLLRQEAALAGSISNDDCLNCHADKDIAVKEVGGKKVSVFVDKERLAASVHGKNQCVSCHADITESPHPDNFVVKPPVCGSCHKAQTESYGASVHGLARAAGSTKAARCVDCHGSHDMGSARQPSLALHPAQQPATCGKCHEKEAQDYRKSVHGKAMAAQVREAPTCTDCHNEHKIEGLRDASPMKIAEQVCGRCHSSEYLNTKYNIPANRVSTFAESYHGLAARLGATNAANCASCHGWHDVLPSSDPESRINPSNLPKTCGNCHPGIGTRLAKEKIVIHAPPGAADGKPWIVNLVTRLYILLIVCVVGGMLLHNALDYIKKVRIHLREAKESPGEALFTRMDQIQHIILMILFALLAYTGFVHKFPDAFWSWPFRAMSNGNAVRALTHRVCGWMFIGLMTFHVMGLLLTRRGRAELRQLMLWPSDLRDVFWTLMYYVGLRQTPPPRSRFTYVEKSEYWALMWGSAVMIITGMMMIFTEVVLRFLPKVWLDLAQVIHFYEAVLATLAIFVWHFYWVIYDPEQYPMNPAWLTQKRLPPRDAQGSAEPRAAGEPKGQPPKE